MSSKFLLSGVYHTWSWPQIMIGIIVVAVITFFHVWQLDKMPRGLYLDESSIGYNAALIAESGHDQFNKPFPIFFRSLEDYKSPLHIYGVATIFKIFGPSVYLLRLTSALFFLLFIALFSILVQRLFQLPYVTLLLMGVAGFLPWIFPLSRIAFEVVSQLPFITGWLLFLHLAYIQPSKKIPPHSAAILAGIFLALSLYAYSTSRLLAWLFLGVWLLIFWKKDRQLTLRGLAAFLVTALLYGIFIATNPGALTRRFALVGYIHKESLTIGDKVLLFIEQYTKHFLPDFLLKNGDLNLRHGIGETGAVSLTCLALLLVGIWYAVQNRHIYKDKFLQLILASTLVAPIAAALTTGEGGNTLRTAALAICFLILSAYGAAVIWKHPQTRVYTIVLAVLLVLEASTYLQTYFSTYAAISENWFQSYDLASALEYAATQAPTIVISPSHPHIQTHLDFYRLATPFLNQVSIKIAKPSLGPNQCVVTGIFESLGTGVNIKNQKKMGLFTVTCSPVMSQAAQ
ncbi:MAG: hypothetical protein HYZ63_04090 [Candidatus Andersenbacteria bacterium]|nr:hypothetical protein [Candidatus Andersenbacteria bacterium]